MFRAKSLLDEILSGEAAGGMPATPQPVQSWFQAPQEVQGWINQTGTDAANIYGNKAVRAWMDANGYDFDKYRDKTDMQNSNQGGEAYSGISGPWTDYMGIGKFLADKGLSAQYYNSGGIDNWRLVDGVGNEMVRGQYDTDDGGWFEKAVPLVIAAMGTAGIGQGLGLWGGGGIGAEAGGGLLSGEGAAQLAAADLAVTPEALAAITPEIGGAGEIAALGAGQVGALNPNMFANEGLAQLTANPPVVSAAELSGITPNVSGLGAAPANMFANEGAKQLAANPPTVTPAELSAVTPSVPPPVLPTSGVNPVRAGEIAGYQTNGALPSSAAVNAGGGLLDTLTGAAGTATQWLKDNPVLGRLLMSGASALVSGLGGSGGGSSATPTNYGPAKQWTSPIQSGLLSAPRNVQQVQPGGLLGGPGVANSGAWQWRK